MIKEPPTIKRAMAFVDGQNLFYSAKDSFGYPYPNYDVKKLAFAVCNMQGWKCEGVHFYTGIPEQSDNLFWNRFWTAKLAHMGKVGVRVFSRPLRYRNQTVKLPDGKSHIFLVGQEKGVDIRIALDVVKYVRRGECDVALVFSQDQDLVEVAEEVRETAQEQSRWIKMASAFPFSPTSRNRRGIDKTDWIRIDRPLYDTCLDPTDYRQKR